MVTKTLNPCDTSQWGLNSMGWEKYNYVTKKHCPKVSEMDVRLQKKKTQKNPQQNTN